MTEAMIAKRPALVRQALLLALATVSGFCGLGYELLWTRVLAVSLGHEIVAVLAVVAAFFVGLALGARLAGDAIDRSSRPLLWYAALELVIGLWAVALIQITPVFNAWMPNAIGAEPSAVRHWSVAFVATLLLLLPATAAMGATLPALERALVACSPHKTWVAEAYASNTLGAVFGIVATTFWLDRTFGHTATQLSLAGANLACAAAAASLAWRAWRTAGDAPHLAAPQMASPQAAAPQLAAPQLASPNPATAKLSVTLFATGFLGLGYEVLVVRVLSQVFENTVYSFALVLAVYLLGTASGAALLRYIDFRLVRASRSPLSTSTLLLATSFVCLLGVLALWAAPSLQSAWLAALPPGMPSALWVEAALGALVLALPTTLMGALFTHLAQRQALLHSLGSALSVNTLGAALAPLVVGVGLLPWLGPKLALLAVSLGYVLLVAHGSTHGAKSTAQRTAAGASLAAGGFCWLVLPAHILDAPEGGRVLWQADGVMASVAIVSDAAGDRYLKVNNHFTMGGTASGFSDRRQAHLPLLLHGSARRALFLGVGTGITLDAARDYPDLAVTAVELVPEVLQRLDLFEVPPLNAWPTQPRVLSADARRFVVSDDQAYDVIVADLFHPSRDGAGSLYTAEHFQAIKQRLTSDGLFCQWLPLYQLDEPTLKTIIRTFLSEFPHVQAHLAHFSLSQPILALIGTNRARAFEVPWLQPRVTAKALQRQLVSLHLNSDFALFGGFVGAADALSHYAGEGRLNTDDRPRVVYSSPALVYSNTHPVSEQLVDLVAQLSTRRGTLLADAEHQSEFSERMNAYWVARDAYLQAGIGVNPTSSLQDMLAQTKPALLRVVRLSPDFIPAYAPLLGMAQELARTDPTTAQSLLTDLSSANPTRPEAGLLLDRLASTTTASKSAP